MNEKEDAEEEHEGDGDYETESSPARRGSRGRARAKGRSGDRRKSRLYLLLPLPYRCPPIPASTEADDVLGEEEDRDGETPTNGKEKKRRFEWDMDVPLGSRVLVENISEKGGEVWKVHVDRNLLLDMFPRIVSPPCPGAQRSGVLRPRWVVHANPPPPGGFSLPCQQLVAPESDIVHDRCQSCLQRHRSHQLPC